MVFGYFATTIVSKDATKEYNTNTSASQNPAFPFHEFKWVELTALQHLIGLVVSLILVVVMKKPIWHSDHKLLIVLTAVCNMVGNLATNAAYAMSNSSTARIIATTQPLITFLLMTILLKGSTFLTVSSFLSVAIIVLGVCGFLLGGLSYTTGSFLVAVVSTTAFAMRNILLKKPSEEWDSSLQKFMLVSLLSTIFVVPLWLVKLAYTQTVSSGGFFAVSSVTHSVYSLASFNVLENVNPVTHAMFTIFIKASTYIGVSNFSYFQASHSWNILISVFVVLVGIYFYQMKDSSSTKQVISKLIFTLIVVVYLFIPKPTVRYNLLQYKPLEQNDDAILGVRERISMAWTYERPIPNSVVTNIVALANQNPKMYQFMSTVEASNVSTL